MKGSLVAGKLADILLLDRDITRIPSESIRDAKVLRTIVGGQTLFRAGGSRP